MGGAVGGAVGGCRTIYWLDASQGNILKMALHSQQIQEEEIKNDLVKP